MYIGVTTYKLRPGKKAAATRIWEESFFPVLKQQKHFQSALWLVAPDMDQAIGIELWDIDVAASSFETSGLFQQLAGKFQGVIVHPPAREQYHANGSHVPTPATPAQPPGDREGGPLQGKPQGAGFRFLDSEAISSIKS